MQDDVKDMILQSLARIEGKLDAHAVDIAANGQRLAVLEAKMEAQKKINDQVENIAKLTNQGMGAKGIVAWLIATGIGIASYFR